MQVTRQLCCVLSKEMLFNNNVCEERSFSLSLSPLPVKKKCKLNLFIYVFISLFLIPAKRVCLPSGWTHTLPEVDQRCMSKALFSWTTQRHPELDFSRVDKLWWYPPQVPQVPPVIFLCWKITLAIPCCSGCHESCGKSS